MSSNYNHPSSFNPYFPNPNNNIITSREMTPAEIVDNDLTLWSNTQFTFDVSPGLRLLDDEPLPTSLSPEDYDPSSGGQVYHHHQQHQPQPLTKPPQVNHMPAASGLTPFLSQITVPNHGVSTVSTSPSSPSTPSVNNLSAIYPSPAPSQRKIPVHPSRMSEELLQRQLSNPQPPPPMVINPPAQQSSPISPHPPTLEATPLQSGLLTPPMTMTGHPYYQYPHMMDSNYVCQLLAEEDKRRRNTAASARFRVKKKLREQALEKASRDMSSKAELLENKVRELEREIKWLRSLIVEKDPRLLEIERPDKQDESSVQGDHDDDQD